MKQKVIIIAEAGVNHNGSFENARKLVDAAAEAGADFVKFQTFKADLLVTKTAAMADYQLKNTGNSTNDKSQYEMLKKLEMPAQWHYDLKNHAQEKGIFFLSTGFDEGSIDFLDELGMALFKIPSGEITNKYYIEHIAKKGRPVILSTGMSDFNDIKSAMDVLIAAGLSKDLITVLHCNTQYPTPMVDVNLLAMNAIKDKFQVAIGYSDHTLGIEISIAAVALGACVIEKHFTLDRNMEGPDHKASLEPRELKNMVDAIRNVELAIGGNGIKEPSDSERANMTAARKSICVVKNLGKGHALTYSDLVMKRPGDGISPMQIDSVISKVLATAVTEGEQLKWNDLLSVT